MALLCRRSGRARAGSCCGLMKCSPARQPMLRRARRPAPTRVWARFSQASLVACRCQVLQRLQAALPCIITPEAVATIRTTRGHSVHPVAATWPRKRAHAALACFVCSLASRSDRCIDPPCGRLPQRAARRRPRQDLRHERPELVLRGAADSLPNLPTVPC